MPRSIDLGSYEKAPVVEEAWHSTSASSLSSEEDDDDTTPMLNDDASPAPKREKPKVTPWPEHPIQWIRSPFMFALDLVLIMLVVIFYTSGYPNSQPNWRASIAGLQGDITGLVPTFEPQVVTFRAYPEYVSNHTSEASLREAREQWIKLVPPGQGFIKLDDNVISEYDIPKPIHYRDGISVGTSMMHGLHCLYMIMSEYDMLAMGMKQPPIDTWHMDHCIDYVRQLLICGGDMALAGEDLPNGSSFLNVPHVCKNYDQVYKWLEDRRDNDGYQFGSHETHYVPP